MAVLVLGGAGYIGSHTAYELIDNGVDVVIADNLETGHKEAVHPKARFYQGDIRDRAFLDGLFEKEPIQGVIHFAANSLVGESMTNPLKYYDNNLCGTKVLLESMVAHGVDKIVFSSTAATYGEPENIPILEGDPTHPTNTYGETKLSMERMFHWVGQAHGLRYVSLRYFNACVHPRHRPGPGPHFGHGVSEQWRREQHLQPGQRRGLHREGGHRHRPEGDRPSHPRPDHPPPGRRPRPAGGEQREGQDHPGLEAPVRRPGDHYRQRLEVAREPPQRLREVKSGEREQYGKNRELYGKPPGPAPRGLCVPKGPRGARGPHHL